MGHYRCDKKREIKKMENILESMKNVEKGNDIHTCIYICVCVCTRECYELSGMSDEKNEKH